jgi:hypothetical protein
VRHAAGLPQNEIEPPADRIEPYKSLMAPEAKGWLKDVIIVRPSLLLDGDAVPLEKSMSLSIRFFDFFLLVLVFWLTTGI